MSRTLEATDREPLQRNSRVRGERAVTSTRLYHAVHNDHRMYLCGCGRSAFMSNGFSGLGRGRRRNDRWPRKP